MPDFDGMNSSERSTGIFPTSSSFRRTRWLPHLAILAVIWALLGCSFFGRLPLDASDQNQAQLEIPTRTPFQPGGKTPTPFQPGPIQQSLPTLQEQATETPLPQAGLTFYDIDLNPGQQRVSIQILPENKRVNGGKPIIVSFIPGKKCNFGDHRGCVRAFLAQDNANVTFVSVHSGVGGEGQAFRNALEGTGINQAGFSLQQVRAKLGALKGAGVTVVQGDTRMEGFTLVAVVRIPASFLSEYFDTPIERALAFAASLNPKLAPLLNPGQPQIIFETCGWKMPGEPWAKDMTSTTASVYLGVIQKSTSP